MRGTVMEGSGLVWTPRGSLMCSQNAVHRCSCIPPPPECSRRGQELNPGPIHAECHSHWITTGSPTQKLRILYEKGVFRENLTECFIQNIGATNMIQGVVQFCSSSCKPNSLNINRWHTDYSHLMKALPSHLFGAPYSVPVVRNI